MKPRRCAKRSCHGYVLESSKSPYYCSKCRSARWKAKYPLHYSYKQLRNDARRRGIAFELTREEYIEFAELTGYALHKGRGRYFLSIDRRDPAKGYSKDNIRAMTVRANSARAAFIGRLPKWLRDEIMQAERGLAGHTTLPPLEELTK